MMEHQSCVAVVNAGSSSIKFGVYSSASLEKWFAGKIERIGLSGTTLTFKDLRSNRGGREELSSDFQAAVAALTEWLERQLGVPSMNAIGHRIVHGMQFTEPALVTDELLAELHRTCPYDPDHLPLEILLIERFRAMAPGIPQIACFDTSFHRTMPRVAQLLAIPRRFDAAGVQRYGFHGLSFEYLMEELRRLYGPDIAQGRVILAHLGNGSSLAAIRDGKSIDTTMGFTPAAGLPMGTRPGDIDPGVAWHLMRTGHTAEQFNDIINHQSGLLGVSETSSDMRDLLARESDDIRAAEAVDLFCYQARKWIGAMAAALGGVDTLVFSGGIGENAFEIRKRILTGLNFLGVELDDAGNAANAPVISAASSAVRVHVISTDEELMIARATSRRAPA